METPRRGPVAGFGQISVGRRSTRSLCHIRARISVASRRGFAQPNWQAEGAGIAEADPVTREPSSRGSTRFSARPCGALRFTSAREMLVVMCTLPALAGDGYPIWFWLELRGESTLPLLVEVCTVANNRESAMTAESIWSLGPR